MPKNRSVETVQYRSPENSVTTILLPGFNRDGTALARVVQRGLEGSNVITYRLPRSDYSQAAIVEALCTEIENNEHRAFVAYAESAGALDLAEVLREYPGLRLDSIVLNAGLGAWMDVNSRWALQVAQLVPGGLIPITTLQRAQRIRAKAPQLDPDADIEAARAAARDSANLTGRQFGGEIRRIANTQPLQRGEFRSRARALFYLGAPDQNGELALQDPAVRLRNACGRWELATRLSARIVLPPTWRGLHTPTPEKPGPVIQVLRQAIGAART